MITDKNGQACQHLQYLPFGETFVEQRTTATYYTPYKFSAKEKDTETGYSYFGARYYDSDLSVWLSVDPLSDKYPSMSAYMYCGGNPVMIVDPDGRDWVQGDGTEKYWDANITSRKQAKQSGLKYYGKSFFEKTTKNRYTYYANDGTKTIFLQPHEVKADRIYKTEPIKQENDNGNPAGGILAGGMSIAAALAFDPIPGDEVVVAVGTLVAAGATWLAYEVGSLVSDRLHEYSEHNKSRPSTKGKHEKGQTRKAQDRNGSKGEKLPPRKRPDGYKGPWPPKR